MPRILILSQDRKVVEQAQDYLELHDLAVQAEASADAALSELQHADADIVLLVMDGELSGISPQRFLERIRTFSKLPILAILPARDEAGQIRLLEAGADMCMPKPLQPALFVSQVQALLRMQARLQSEEVRQGGLPELRGIRIDPVRRRVRVRGREKKFTRKEFDLLYFLMTHPEQVFTKENLYREVWNEEAVGGMATVIMHIKKIRNKIEERPSQPQIIATEWGVGYYFAAEESP
ncbi:MAG: response regulator transcription factor [Lachnospiraceae bacterium]|nr:response regulator transcription factor [Lachnospiraceae bacterium]